MNLGIFLHRGGSLENWRTVGQDKRVVDYYLNRYAKKFDKVYFFSYADVNEKRNDLAKNVIIVPNSHRIPFSVYGPLIPILHRNLIKKCDVFRVFHISGTPSALISKLLFGKPYISTYGYMWLHDIRFHRKFAQLPIAKLTEFFGLKKADKIIITLDKTKRYVKKYVNDDKIIHIPNGVDTNLFIKTNIKRSDKFRLISIGRFMKIKNYDNLIRAASKIKNIELVLCGDGPEKENLIKIAKSLGCELILPGMLPNEKLPEEINKADIFILPSHSEGMPKALLEAMSCEIPCIVSDLPTLRETIFDLVNGVVCERSPEGIYDKIVYIKEHKKEAARIAKAARREIIKNYSIHELIEKEIDIMKKLAAASA